MRSIVIGTRGSALARWQAGHVAARLRAEHEGLEARERIIKTAGDEPGDVPIANTGATGVFVRQLEAALQERTIDVAVHSLKDMPTEQPAGLTIAAVLERGDPRDALVSPKGSGLFELPSGSVLGTGSPRRSCQLLHARPDLDIVPVRGNVDTRIRNLDRGDVHGLVLAMAGIERLQIDSVPVVPLPLAHCVPAVGQGVVAVEAREADDELLALLEPLSHAPTWIAAAAERSFLRRLGGGCLAPATAHAELANGVLRVEALVGDADGRSILVDRESGLPEEAVAIGERLAARLLVAGARGVLSRARSDPTQGHAAD